MAGGYVDPRQRCLKFEVWPQWERLRWAAATGGPNRSLQDMRATYNLKPVTLMKAQAGYSRFLGFMDWAGLLDPDVAPETRVTSATANAFYEHMRAVGNRDHTIVSRFQELQTAMRVLVPQRNWAWLTNPDGWTLSASFLMERRPKQLHHSKTLREFGDWLIQNASQAANHQKACARVRDGIMVHILAYRAPRARSLEAMQVGRQIRKVGDHYRMILEHEDTKNEKHIECDLPASFTANIDRYLAHERAVLLGDEFHDAMWVDKDGKPMTALQIRSMMRDRTERHFGKAFGTHTFRYSLITTSKLEDPDHPGIGAAVLGITEAVANRHYDLGTQVSAANKYHEALAEERRRASQTDAI